MLTVGDARRRVEQRKLGDQKTETARFQRLLKKRKSLFLNDSTKLQPRHGREFVWRSFWKRTIKKCR
jgi:hypothetical protein